MIDVQRRIFERLADVVRQHKLEHAAPEPLDSARFIEGSSEDEDALKRAEIVRFEQVHGLGAVSLFRWNGRYYASLPAHVPVEVNADSEVTGEITNTGVACLILAHDENEIVAEDPHYVVDQIFGRAGRYSITEIERFFSPQRRFATRPSLDDCLPAEMWSRCLAMCARGIATLMPPRWLASSVIDFVQACREPVSRFAGDALLSAVRAGSWNHGYLEIYRAVEALFRVMCVEDFIGDFRQQMATESRTAVLRSIEDRLMWRMRDDQALERLVSRLSQSDADAINSCLGVRNSQEAARKFYMTRNRVAHGALFGTDIPNRDNLLRASLLLIKGAYIQLEVSPLWIPG